MIRLANLPPNEWWFHVLEFKVIDGDTVDCVIDLGFDITIKERVRLYGIDAPETRTKNLTEKAQGLFVKEWLENNLASAEVVSLHSKVYARGKYGRVLGDLYADGENLNLTMLSEKLVKPYGS
jgi:micrococcal nuclease